MVRDSTDEHNNAREVFLTANSGALPFLRYEGSDVTDIGWG